MKMIFSCALLVAVLLITLEGCNCKPKTPTAPATVRLPVK